MLHLRQGRDWSERLVPLELGTEVGGEGERRRREGGREGGRKVEREIGGRERS